MIAALFAIVYIFRHPSLINIIYNNEIRNIAFPLSENVIAMFTMIFSSYFFLTLAFII